MKWCLDFLFGAEYPQIVRANRPMGWGVGLFAGNYRRKDGGLDPYKPAHQLSEKLAQDGCPSIRIQLMWSDAHKYGDKDIPLLEREAPLYQALAVRYPDTDFILSPFCEYGELPRPIDYYAKRVADLAPHCEVICSPSAFFRGAPSKRYANEVHGHEYAIKNGDYDWSLDGTSGYDCDIEALKARHAGARRCYLWIPQFNRKVNDGTGEEGDRTPRPERKVVPSPEQIAALVFLANPKGKASLPDSYTWKAHADQHGVPGPSPRESKPVLIAPPDAIFPKAELLGQNGKVVQKLPYAGPMTDKKTKKVVGQLYRMEEFGYQLMERIAKTQKAKVLRLRLGGKVVGRVNAAFRENNYRK